MRFNPQLRPHQILNPLCHAGDQTCVPSASKRLPILLHHCKNSLTRLIVVTFFFFSFYGCTCSTWKFLGYRSNQSCSCRPTAQPHQHLIQAASATYAAACRNAGSLTHWGRPKFELISSWILVRFLSHWATTGMPCGDHFELLCGIPKTNI